MARVSQEEMDRRIATYGGAALVHSPTASKKKIPNPAHKQNGGTSYTVPEEIEVEVQRWQGAGTGAAELEAYQMPDGSWEIVKEQPATKPTAANNQATTRRIEGTPIGNGQFDNERPVMVTRDASGKVTESRPLTPAESTEWRNSRERSRNPGGKTDADIAAETKAADDKKRQAEADARVAAAANKPAVDIRDDGKGGVVAVSTYPDGRVETKPVPGVTGKPTTVTVDGVVYEKGPDGKYAPAAGIPQAGVGRKNIDPFTPDPTQPDLGVGVWAAAQRAKIGGASEAGGITQQDYDDAVKEALGSATVYITNTKAGHDVRRTAEQDARNQRQTLSQQAADDYARARKAYDDTWKYANPNSTARFSTVEHIMNEQARYRQEREATAREAPPLHPMFQWTQQAGAGQPTAPPPVAAPVLATPPPAPALGPPPAALATPPPGAVPAPVVAAPALAAPSVHPVAPAPPALPARDDWRTNPGDSSVPFNPPAGEPGHQPGMPVGMAPPPEGPVSAWASQVISPEAMASASQPSQGPQLDPAAYGHTPDNPMVQPGQGQRVLPNLQQQAASVYDPFPAAGRMAQWGLPMESILQAMREMGMVPEEQTA
jgi:hypothetical protein